MPTRALRLAPPLLTVSLPRIEASSAPPISSPRYVDNCEPRFSAAPSFDPRVFGNRSRHGCIIESGSAHELSPWVLIGKVGFFNRCGPMFSKGWYGLCDCRGCGTNTPGDWLHPAAQDRTGGQMWLVKSWMMDAVKFNLEVQSVVAMRLIKIATNTNLREWFRRRRRPRRPPRPLERSRLQKAGA
jgi:hypothetical protein